MTALRSIVFLALRQISDNKLLHGIALGGIALGILTLVAMHGVLDGFEHKFLESLLRISPHVTVHDKALHPDVPMLVRYAGTPLVARIAHPIPSDRQTRIARPRELVRLLERDSTVEAAAASVAGQVLIERGGKTISIDLRGIDIAAQEKVTPLRRFATAGSFASLSASSSGLAVGRGVADELGLSLGDVVHGAAPAGEPTDLEVVAIFEVGIPPIDKGRGYALLRTAQTLLGRGDTIERVEIRLRDADRAETVTTRLERMLGYDAESWQEANASSLSLFVMQNLISSLVVGAILVVSGFGILAVQIMIVLQKQRDIAILRSFGFRKSDIRSVFLLQGAIVALGGGLLGDVLGKLALLQLATVKAPSAGLVKSDALLIWEDPTLYGWGLVFALAIGMAASVIPAWRASRVEPVAVLRGQIG